MMKLWWCFGEKDGGNMVVLCWKGWWRYGGVVLVLLVKEDGSDCFVSGMVIVSDGMVMVMVW